VNTALSQGKEYNRVLVLHPTTTGWLYANGTTFDRVDGDAGKTKLAELKKSQIDLVLALYGRQVDFDLGDEFIMEEFGDIAQRSLVVGHRAYETVIIPPGMENIRGSTLSLLERYLESGGQVLSLESLPSLVNGRKSERCARLRTQFEKQWTRCETLEELVRIVRRDVPPRFSTPERGPLPMNLCWRRAETSFGTLYFFCNPFAEPIDAQVLLPGTSVAAFDTATGSVTAGTSERTENGQVVHVTLQPRGHELLLVTDKPMELPAAVHVKPGAEISLSPSGIDRVSPNLLYLDYCDIEAYGKSVRDIGTVHADTMNWRWQGFDDNPWGKQFRRTLIDRPVDPDSEMRVRYRFTVGKQLPESARRDVQACIEYPWLYSVTVNGNNIPSESGERWFDENVRALPIGEHVREGENVIELYAHPFHMLCQLMPVYIRGRFSLDPREKGFALTEEKPLVLGDWTRQGAPFYDEHVRYSYRFTLKSEQRGLIARVPRWQGSVAVVSLDDTEIGPVVHPPYECLLAHAVAPGEHVLSVDIVGNMKNKMGTHFGTFDSPGRWSFQYSPPSLPPGDQYRVSPTGLSAPPTLWSTKA